jgi:2,3-diaminopropionate biosynthesis protein SbnA
MLIGTPMTKGILSCVGNTPLVELSRLFVEQDIRLFAKLEQFNPGGSSKDRPALFIIEHGMETGAIRPGTVILESSSGNMGIGLAQACAYHKLKFICVVDPKITAENLSLLKAYDAEVDMVQEPDPETGEFLAARLKRVKQLAEGLPGSCWVNQYANELNCCSHRQTMHEIATTLDGKLDYLFCATSTCGTLRGCAEYKRLHRLPTKIIAVDAVGSAISGDQRKPRLIPGHGASMVPQLFHDNLADDFVRVTDLECIVGCYRLLREEALLAGGSSGGIISAIARYVVQLKRGAVCVAILPDRGERYLHTIYSPDWVTKHFGNVSCLGQAARESAKYASVKS